MFSILNRFYHQLGSPKEFYPISTVTTPIFGLLALALFIPGAYLGLVVAPADYQQGDSYRIIFVHVPCRLAIAHDLRNYGCCCKQSP